MNKKINLTQFGQIYQKLIIFLGLSLLQLGLSPYVTGETRHERLEKIYNTAIEKDEAMVGTAMAIVHKNAIVFKKTSGIANLEHSIFVDEKTLFHWASVSKQFTGVAIAKLIDEGKISLTEQVQKYIPELPTFSYPITVENLIYHSSGLREWSILLQTAGYGAAQTNIDVLRMLSQQQKLNFIPGAEFSYNNSGYTLLAVVIERVTGKGFNEYMASSFFKPLNMDTAMFREKVNTVIPSRASSYTFDNEHEQIIAITDQLAITGASGLYASLADMTKWATYIANLAVTHPEVYAVIMRDGKLNNSHIVPYGFGFWKDKFYGTLRLDHTGSWAGYKAYTLYLPEQQFAAIGVRNFDESIWKIQRPIIRDVLSNELGIKLKSGGKKDSAKHSRSINVTEYPDLPGTYRLSGNAYIKIERSGSKFIASAFPKFWGASLSSNKEELKLDTQRQFVAPELNLTFVINENNIQQLKVYDSNSGVLTYSKLDSFNIDPEKLVGRFYSEELDTAFNVEFKDGRLSISNLRFGKISLIHIAGLDFDGNNKIVDFVSFLPDPNGIINALEVSTERSRKQRFERITINKGVN